jgi:hypothetical protein
VQLLKGERASIGATRIAPNGYHYTKTLVDGQEAWRLTHHIKMEGYLGRPLLPGERVHFRTSNKLDFSKENIFVHVQGTSSIKKTLARLYARRDEIAGEILYWEGLLEEQSSTSAS